MVTKKTASKGNLGGKRDEVMKLREQVATARDERLAAEIENQEKLDDVQLDGEIERLKVLLAQETGFLEDTTSEQVVDNKNKEV
jgi:hypothetical protein